MIAGIGLGQGRKFAARLPVEAAAIDNDAADRNAVAADPFGDRMHDDVGAKRERAAEIRRGKSVVDQQRDAGRMGDLGDLRDVEHFQPRIADGLADDEPGVRPDGGTEAVEVARLDETRRDAEARQRVGEEIDAAAIERGGRNDMVAGAKERGDSQMHRRHAARRAHGADAVLQRREPFFQHRIGRIGNARIDVTGAFEIKQPGGMIGVVEHVRGCLVDRDRTRPRHRIGVLPGMQTQSFKGGRFWSGHAFLVRMKIWESTAMGLNR